MNSCGHKGRTVKGKCHKCYMKEYFKKRYHSDPEFRERFLKNSREWNKKTNYHMNRYNNDPEHRAKVRAYQLGYMRKLRAEGKSWNQRNPEEYRAYLKKWRKNNPDKLEKYRKKYPKYVLMVDRKNARKNREVIK